MLRLPSFLVLVLASSSVPGVVLVAPLLGCGDDGGNVDAGRPDGGTPPDGGVWEEAEQVNETGRTAADPQVDVDPLGHAFAVWSQFNDDGVESVWANVRSAESWGKPVTIEREILNATTPEVAADLDGGAFAVWAQVDSGITTHVWAARYLQTGTWAEPIALEAATGTSQFPDVTAAKGEAWVVWQRAVGAAVDIWAAQFSGSGWSEPQQLESGDPVGTTPRVATDTKGGAFAVWEEAQVSGRTNIRAAVFERGAWLPAEALEDAAGNAKAPQVAADAEGRAFAVWQQNDGSGFDHIFAAVYERPAGWGAAERLDQQPTNGSNPQVAGDLLGAKQAVAVWQQNTSAGGVRVWSARWTPQQGWLAPEAVTAEGEVANRPDVASAVDRVWAVWQQNAGAGTDVRGAEYTAASGWGAGQVLEGQPGTAQIPRVAAVAPGFVWSVWQQFDPELVGNIWSNGGSVPDPPASSATDR